MERLLTTILGSTVMVDKEPTPAFAAYAQATGLEMQDLFPIKFWLASVGVNKNGDFWGAAELEAAAPSIALKPLNINHDRDKETDVPRQIIGVAYAGEFVENPDTGIPSVLARAVLFSYQFRKDTEFNAIMERVAEGSCKSSMECVFTQFTQVNPETGDALKKLFKDTEFDAARKDGKVARKFDNPMFTAAAILLGVPPADPNAAVMDDDFGVSLTEPVTEKEDEEKEGEACTETEAIESHGLAHLAYNEIKRTGTFRDWSLRYAMEVHDASVVDMSRLDIEHTTPIYGESVDVITRQLLDSWIAKAGVSYDLRCEGDVVTRKNCVVVCASEADRDRILDEIPLECLADIHIQISNEPVLAQSQATKMLPILSKIFSGLTGEGSIVYNYNELGICGYASWLNKNGIDCNVSYGSIETLNRHNAFWIDLSGGFVFVNAGGEFQYRDYADHCFSRIITVNAGQVHEVSEKYHEGLEEQPNYSEITMKLLG